MQHGFVVFKVCHSWVTCDQNSNQMWQEQWLSNQSNLSEIVVTRTQVNVLIALCVVEVTSPTKV